MHKVNVAPRKSNSRTIFLT